VAREGPGEGHTDISNGRVGGVSINEVTHSRHSDVSQTTFVFVFYRIGLGSRVRK
jgi:hypothetical protein